MLISLSSLATTSKFQRIFVSKWGEVVAIYESGLYLHRVIWKHFNIKVQIKYCTHLPLTVIQEIVLLGTAHTLEKL